jgi:hypothetical protein
MFLTQLRVGKITDGDSTFMLYETAGTRNGRKQYMMTSVRYQDHLVAMAPSGTRAGQMFKMFDTTDARPFRELWTVCRPRGHQGPNLQFGVQLEDARVWSYITHFSKLVFGWDEKLWGPPKISAQWIPSSPLHVDFDECPE